MTFKKRLRDFLKSLYVQGCLDSLNKNNEGKGKELCEQWTNKSQQQILDLVKECMPEREEYIPICGQGLDNEAIYNENSRVHGHNNYREEMQRRLNE